MVSKSVQTEKLNGNIEDDFITTLLTKMQSEFDFEFYNWLRRQGIKKMVLVPKLVQKHNLDIKHHEFPFVMDDEFIPEELLYLDSIRASVPVYRIRLLIEMKKKPNSRTLKHFKRMINHIKEYDLFRLDLDIHPDFVNTVEWNLSCNHIRFAPQHHCLFNFAFMYNFKFLYSVEIAQTTVNFKNFTFILKCLNIRILTLIDCEYTNISEINKSTKVNLFCLSSTQRFKDYTATELINSFFSAFPCVSHVFFCGGKLNKIPFHSLNAVNWPTTVESFYFESEEYLDLDLFDDLFSQLKIQELKIQMKVADKLPTLRKGNFKDLKKCSFIFDIEKVHDNNVIESFLFEFVDIKSVFIEFGIKLGVVLMTRDFEMLLQNENYELLPMTDSLYMNLVKTGNKYLLSNETFIYAKAICNLFEKDLPSDIKIIK